MLEFKFVYGDDSKAYEIHMLKEQDSIVFPRCLPGTRPSTKLHVNLQWISCKT